MSFIRIKKIKDHKYAYLVKNKYVKGKVKQKNSKYLGKVIYLDVFENIGFFEYYSKNIEEYLKGKQSEEILKDLVRWEAHKHGFKESGNVLVNRDISIDIKNNKVKMNNKNVALKINEGFMTEYGLKKLSNFSIQNEEIDGPKLARMFIDTGIMIPKELFIALF